MFQSWPGDSGLLACCLLPVPGQWQRAWGSNYFCLPPAPCPLPSAHTYCTVYQCQIQKQDILTTLNLLFIHPRSTLDLLDRSPTFFDCDYPLPPQSSCFSWCSPSMLPSPLPPSQNRTASSPALGSLGTAPALPCPALEKPLAP